MISTVVFDRKDCYYDAERDLLAIAKFVVLPRPGPDVVFFLVDFVAILVTVKTNYS